MRDLKELNINEGGKPVRRAPASPIEISEFELRLGFEFSAEYKEMIFYSNGGHPEKDSFIPLSSSRKERWSVDVFYHWGSDTISADNIVNVINKWGEYIGKDAIPIARDPGGNQICLANGKDQTVFLCIHDEGFRRIEVASTFGSFLDLLEEDSDMI